MKAKWLTVICLLGVVLVAVGCGPAKPATSAAPQGYETLTMEGSSMGSGGTTAIMVFAKTLAKYYPEITWASRTGQGATAPIRLTNGEVKLAVGGLSGFVDCFGYDKVPSSRIRSIALPMEETDYSFLIPADKPWKDISEVPKGTGLCPGAAGTSSPIICEAWLNVCGRTKSDFNWVPMDRTASADAWRSGKIDLLFSSRIGAKPPYLIDMFNSPRKPKPMGLSEAQAKKATAEGTFQRIGVFGPKLTKLMQQDPEHFTYEIYAGFITTMLLSRDDFPDEIAYKMARILDEHMPEMIEVYGPMKDGGALRHIELVQPGVNIHPAVARYYREKGYLK